MKSRSLKKSWSLLNSQERRGALLVLFVVVLAALTSAVMVGSIMPFLTVLSNPDRIHNVPMLSLAYSVGGFESDFSFLTAVGLVSLAAIVVANVLQMLRLYLVTKFATMKIHTLSLRLLSVYLRHPYEYFLNKHTGELGSQILAETQKVVELFYRPVVEAIAAAFSATAIVALLIWINPLVVLIALVVAGGLYIFSYKFSRRIVSRYGQARADANRDRFRIANEVLAGVKDVKLLGREINYLHAYSSPSFKMAESETMAIFIGTLPLYGMQIMAFGGMIILILALIEPSSLSEGGALSELLPTFGVFAFGGQRLIPELARVYTGLTQMNFGAPIVESLYNDIEAETGLSALPGTDTRPIGLRNCLELRGITYSYPNADNPALSGVSLSIRAGERIGVVGGSGAGKTTFADIIMGLLRADEGEMLADGIKICDQNLLSWQRSVGYVQQGIFLSDASILENIALGIPREEIDQERAFEAARIACLDTFVDQTPEGYDTKIGERGVRLSGGQRQRIGIARAIYNDASLIVFDEATSALDNITEHQVMESIDNLPGNKTVILIAHRLSTLRKCDRLVVMDGGKIVGIGTWAEMVASNLQFQKLSSVTSLPVVQSTLSIGA